MGLVAPGPALVGGVPRHPRRLMVRAAGPAAENAVVMSGVKVLHRMPEIGWSVVEVPKNRLQSTRARLNRLPGVRADLDRAARPAYTPNDPMWNDMWHFRAINADRAWDLSFGSPVTVAIIDTGVMVDHEDLADNMWRNPGEIPGNQLDDDNNGYVDDVFGYDFAHNTPDVTDNFGHGTNCAGLVAAVQDNQASPGTERVRLYDWSTGSYPYGSFVQIGSSALPTGPVTSTYPVPNPARFIDREGTMYMKIETTDNVADGTELRLNLAQMRHRVPE